LEEAFSAERDRSGGSSSPSAPSSTGDRYGIRIKKFTAAELDEEEHLGAALPVAQATRRRRDVFVAPQEEADRRLKEEQRLEGLKGVLLYGGEA
jgi:hypothetical protein